MKRLNPNLIIRTLLLASLLLAGIVLTGCSLFDGSADLPLPEETKEGTTTTSQPDSSAEAPLETPTPGSIRLKIWVPPHFSPAPDAPTAVLLQERLAEFERQNPGVSIEVRVKAEEGPSGLLDALTTTSAAAPLALPDLVALPHRILHEAASQELIYPFDELTDSMSEDDWYDYARELSQLQNSLYGLPFAGDVQLLTYRPVSIESPPQDWEAALESPGPMAFPAADPLALFTLAQYQALGGEVLDEQGRPYLDQAQLTEVLNFYQQANEQGLFPLWLTQLQSDQQAWDAFDERRSDMVVSCSTRYLEQGMAGMDVAPVLTADSSLSTVATGWVWALAAANSEHHELSVRLAEHLSEAQFLAEWTRSVGYLPPRPSALELWIGTRMRSRFDLISQTAQILPPVDILAVLGPILEKATVDVIKQQSDPASAAQAAIAALQQPQ